MREQQIPVTKPIEFTISKSPRNISACDNRQTRSLLEMTTFAFGLLITGLLLATQAQADATNGAWGPVIQWPHVPVSMANLPNGKILSWSGSERRTWPTTEQTYSATFDPVNNQFEEIFHPSHNMFCAHQSMAEDGDVFVTGGRNQLNSPWTSVFDYETNS